MRRFMIVCALLVLGATVWAACDDGGPATPAPTPRGDTATPTITAVLLPTVLSGGGTVESAPPAPTAVTETSVVAGGGTPQSPAAKLPQLAAGWTRIATGGETSCARGTSYAFWARPGKINKLLVYFEGGGGCWNYETCREGSTYFDDDVNEGDNPLDSSGMLDLDNPDNPFKDYYAVFLPSCTGDVYMGNKTQTYRSEAGEEVVINHKGFANGTAVMDWIYRSFGGPESIFVTGCSAGSVGSIMFAPYLINHYPISRVYQLGDSLAFVFDHPVELQDDWAAHDNFPPWIPDLAKIAPGYFTTASFYSTIARFYPGYTFAQYNTAYDDVQQRYYFAAARTPTPGPFREALEASLNEITANAPNFRSYLAGGGQHCITPRPDFYTREVGGVRFRDWVADLANGKPVANIRCSNCDSP